MTDRIRLWVLEGRDVREARDWQEWAECFGGRNRIVAKTDVAPGIEVSTVFLGLDHRHFGKGPPLLFETMTFTDYGCADVGFGRWSTWDEAEAGHARAVEDVRASIGSRV